jgi:NADPH2:quinone reductase
MITVVRAIVMSEFGTPEVLVEREVDDPVPRVDEALIEVEYVNVTFVETQIRAGRAPRKEMLPALPTIPGNGVGGVVAGVGTRVISSTGGSGAYAERVAVPTESLIAVPESLSLRDATALLSDGRTALGLIERAAIKPGETVLIEAAAGGVGSLLVQLARQAGARVIALAGGERKLQLARELGAEIALDYTRAAWPGELAAAVGGSARFVDVVFDGVGGDVARVALLLLRDGGRMCSYGGASGSFMPIAEDDARARGVTLLRGAVPDPRQLKQLTEVALKRAVAGELKPVIGQTFPLADAATAHRAIESRATVGKTLLV